MRWIDLVMMVLVLVPAAFASGISAPPSVAIPNDPPGVPAPLADWTFMLYMNADNNLEDAAIANFLEMAMVGSTSAVNIVLQIDRIPGFTKDYGNWKDTRRFRVGQGMTPDPGQELMILGEVNMGQGVMVAPGDGSLEDFVCWTCSSYPAARYALILWDHGDGWRDAGKLPFKSAGQDWTNDDRLYMPEVREALENAAAAGCVLDLIGFDECLMAMLEVAYQVHDFGDVMVASEKMEPGSGWPYDLIMADLVAMPAMDAAILGQTIVQHYASSEPNETQSALDLAAVPGIAAAVSDLGLAMDGDRAAIETARSLVRQYNTGGASNHIDLYNFADLLCQQLPSGAIHDAAMKVINLFPQVVIACHGDPARDYGMTIYFPEAAKYMKEDYNGGWIIFPRDTYWDDFLRWYFELPWLYCRGVATPGSLVEVRVVGTQGTTPVILVQGTGIQDPPTTTMYGDLYLTFPLVTVNFLGPIPANGLLVQPAYIPASWQPGDKHPFQVLLGPINQASELSNLMVLEMP